MATRQVTGYVLHPQAQGLPTCPKHLSHTVAVRLVFYKVTSMVWIFISFTNSIARCKICSYCGQDFHFDSIKNFHLFTEAS